VSLLERLDALSHMMPLVTAIKSQPRSKLSNGLHSWHVGYQFCGLPAQATVYAKNEADVRAKGIDQLRLPPRAVIVRSAFWIEGLREKCPSRADKQHCGNHCCGVDLEIKKRRPVMKTLYKTEDYGVFKHSLIARIGQVSIYVQDIGRSRQWYETLGGLRHSRTCEEEPHPFKPGWTIRCCYMSAAKHEECLVLVEERDPNGKVTVPSGMSFFHTAFELEGNRLEDVVAFAVQAKQVGFVPNYGPVRHNGEPPLGDGETGGNVACYFYDPDYNNVEFCGAMDTIENYRARYGDTRGSARA
jgi:catechol 2,3-dioxygenase-like lactoylglutathione lyase family enzyme